MKKFYHLLILGLISACTGVVSKEKQPLVNAVNEKVGHIDANHRVQIVEDDFHQGDSIYKVRGYFMDGFLLKLVGVLHTPTIDRDDYFYFENNTPIFSGHVVVKRSELLASEYKYYYNQEGLVDEALFWEDHYEPHKRFPHERFKEFEPNMDSLMAEEHERLSFFLEKLSMEGFEIKHLNEYLEANRVK